MRNILDLNLIRTLIGGAEHTLELRAGEGKGVEIVLSMAVGERSRGGSMTVFWLCCAAGASLEAAGCCITTGGSSLSVCAMFSQEEW